MKSPQMWMCTVFKEIAKPMKPTKNEIQNRTWYFEISSCGWKSTHYISKKSQTTQIQFGIVLEWNFTTEWIWCWKKKQLAHHTNATQILFYSPFCWKKEFYFLSIRKQYFVHIFEFLLRWWTLTFFFRKKT